jgi:RNA polymerase sigma-70 factor (ECF subfamily)
MDPREEFLSSTMGAMDLVYNIARRMMPRVEDAQDLVQDTYLAAFAAWVKGRKPDRVEPWLATICLNLGRSRFRREARRLQEVSTEFAQAVAGTSDPEREALASLDATALRQAMWALDEGQRVALALVDIAGLSTTEAAKAMGTPRGTVLSRLHRGRRSLARLLGDQVKEREA